MTDKEASVTLWFTILEANQRKLTDEVSILLRWTCMEPRGLAPGPLPAYVSSIQCVIQIKDFELNKSELNGKTWEMRTPRGILMSRNRHN